MVTAIIRAGFALGPLLFGLFFIPPVAAQIVVAMDWTLPFGLSPLAPGFILGGSWGLYAQWRGSWLSWQL